MSAPAGDLASGFSGSIEVFKAVPPLVNVLQELHLHLALVSE
jgi:hypothetical protein